ncbi:MAG: hypothetical protein ACK4SS_01355, partial [Cypionkella sp.]
MLARIMPLPFYCPPPFCPALIAQPLLRRPLQKQHIFQKRPKRADIYWFVHVDTTDDPYTMEYKV